MAAADTAAAGQQGVRDTRYDWIQERVCSSLKGITQDGFQKLVQGEARYVVCLGWRVC
jgi:hypothetical protein